MNYPTNIAFIIFRLPSISGEAAIKDEHSLADFKKPVGRLPVEQLAKQRHLSGRSSNGVASKTLIIPRIQGSPSPRFKVCNNKQGYKTNDVYFEGCQKEMQFLQKTKKKKKENNKRKRKFKRESLQ
uniref:Formin-like protein n=1 Tax=Rhizophora mucronata TaxID=61149 RepID=A0A2P2IUR5_RHIMU